MEHYCGNIYLIHHIGRSCQIFIIIITIAIKYAPISQRPSHYVISKNTSHLYVSHYTGCHKRAFTYKSLFSCFNGRQDGRGRIPAQGYLTNFCYQESWEGPLKNSLFQDHQRLLTILIFQNENPSFCPFFWIYLCFHKRYYGMSIWIIKIDILLSSKIEALSSGNHNDMNILRVHTVLQITQCVFPKFAFSLDHWRWVCLCNRRPVIPLTSLLVGPHSNIRGPFAHRTFQFPGGSQLSNKRRPYQWVLTPVIVRG